MALSLRHRLQGVVPSHYRQALVEDFSFCVPKRAEAVGQTLLRVRMVSVLLPSTFSAYIGRKLCTPSCARWTRPVTLRASAAIEAVAELDVTVVRP